VLLNNRIAARLRGCRTEGRGLEISLLPVTSSTWVLQAFSWE
jgi:hypothetical protein